MPDTETELETESAETDTDLAIEEPEGLEDETEASATDTQEAGAADEEQELVVTIGEEPPPAQEEQRAPEWVRDLRKKYRELQHENRELTQKLQAVSGAEHKPQEAGIKPTLEGCGYDEAKFETELTAWHERKRQAQTRTEQEQAAQVAQQKAWDAKLDAYGKAKAELKVKDYDDAESTVQDLFSVTQQGIVLQGADNPAILIYALGKNPGKAKELAALSDPVQFAVAIGKLETKLKMSSRSTTPPPPEKPVQGNGRLSGSSDATLERLRADAEKTGNYTKVIAYKKQLRAKA
jgi:hypothetical protein